MFHGIHGLEYSFWIFERLLVRTGSPHLRCRVGAQRLPPVALRTWARSDVLSSISILLIPT